MRNLKMFSVAFIVFAFCLMLNSYSIASGIEAFGDNLTGNTAIAASSGNASDTAAAARISDDAENSSVKSEKSSGKKTVFGKIFSFFEGLFDEAVGFFKKIGSALGFKGCENSDKTAQTSNGGAVSEETVASNNTQTSSNNCSSANTCRTATTANNCPSSTRVTQVSTPLTSSANGGSILNSTQASAIANNTATSAVSNTDDNTQTSTVVNNTAENNIQTIASSLTGVTGTIPERAADAESGSVFMARVKSMSLLNYDKAVLDEIMRGNIPDFLKDFKEVKVGFKTKDGKEHTASYYVMPDYLAIGSNDDFVRVPMTPMSAQKIADMYGCQLPTKKMVDDIYDQAAVKLNPQPISVDKGISKISNFAEHQKMVEKQRAGKPLGALTAGDKKDVVITNLLDQAAAKGKKQVAIYGWHQKNGKAIQPLSTIHNYYHVDYSHGIRLVKNMMTLDGKSVKVADILKDGELSKALSGEGTIKNTKAHR